MSRLLTKLRRLEGAAREQAQAALDSGRPLEVCSGNHVKFRGALSVGAELAKDYYLRKVESSGPWVFMFDATVFERPTLDRRDFGVVYDARGAEGFEGECAPEWSPPEGLRILGQVTAGGALRFEREHFYGVPWPPQARDVERARRAAGVGVNVMSGAGRRSSPS